MEKDNDYNFLERAKAFGDAISKQPNLFPSKITPSFFGEYKNFEDLKKAYKNKTIGKQYIDNELNKLNAAWDLLPDSGKKGVMSGLKVLGNTYEDIRTVEGVEKWDPGAWITAGTVRGLEGVGWLSDKLIAKPVSYATHNWLGIDKRGADAAGFLTEILVGDKGLSKVSKATKLNNLFKGNTAKLFNQVPVSSVNRINPYKLNDLKAFSFATKVDDLTGITNVKSEVMQMLYKADNMEDVFSGQTLKTIKNIQEQYPITPTKHGANLPSYITATSARARNKALKAKGITKYKDELGHFWRLEGSTKQQYRNITFRDAERQATNPFTGKLGGRYTATRKAANLRTRDLKASSAEEAKYIADIEATKARINRELNLKPSDANYMTLEHRIAQNDWKKWNLPGNPHDSANLWLSTKYEASIKTKIENIIRTTKRIKQRYVVDFNPQNNALHVMKFDEFKLNDLPKGKRFKKNKKGEYNVQEIERYLKTLE